ncbi:hypothetical protein [Bacillus sp. Marseille-Q1617]|uniref:hypothetical protein n=1 Tax=Bacillus sp. Marseille-Q1617 TaxID=2736887 RepID=UPI00158E294D|nr:hypothetical protein [Bacillus sp. Marseille-Q1617]
MNALLFAAGAYLLLLPFLIFIPVNLTFKQKVTLSFTAFCVTTLALLGSEFLPFISVLAIVVLLIGLTAYIAQSRIQDGNPSRHDEPYPEPLPPAAQDREPKIYQTTKEHNPDESVAETESEANLDKEKEEGFIQEDQQDYIKELDWEDIQPVVTYEAKVPDAFENQESAAEKELPAITDRTPGPVNDPSSFQRDEEEEEYNRLFSGIKR